jgi:hypothetical protein
MKRYPPRIVQPAVRFHAPINNQRFSSNAPANQEHSSIQASKHVAKTTVDQTGRKTEKQKNT